MKIALCLCELGTIVYFLESSFKTAHYKNTNCLLVAFFSVSVNKIKEVLAKSFYLLQLTNVKSNLCSSALLLLFETASFLFPLQYCGLEEERKDISSRIEILLPKGIFACFPLQSESYSPSSVKNVVIHSLFLSSSFLSSTTILFPFYLLVFVIFFFGFYEVFLRWFGISTSFVRGI